MATERIETELDLTGNGARSTPVEDDDAPGKLEVVVTDDTPEQDRGREQRKPGTKSAVPSDEEIGEYTKGVQDRFRQMKWEYHEERRAKEAWERQSSAAVDFAKRVHAENQKLRDMVSKGHKTLLDSTKSAAESEMAALQESLKGALESGNTALAADLQGKLSRAAARAEAQNHITPITFPTDADPGDAAAQQQQAPQRQQVRVSDSMQNWMDENPWFNQNKRMTAFAFGVHEELIDKGVPLESPKYFAEVNRAMREAFPDNFDDAGDERPERRETQDRRDRNGAGRDDQRNEQRQDRRPAPRRTVAAVTRAPAGRSRERVTLTLSEAAVARKMGITNEQYAAEKVRLENQDG